MIHSEGALALIRSRLASVWSDHLESVIRSLYLADHDSFDHEDIDDIVAVARAWLRVESLGVVATSRPVGKVKSGPGRDSRSEHYEALSLLLAQEAAKDSEVIAVRAAVGRLIPWPDLGSWILKTAAREGQPTLWVQVPAPPQSRLKMTTDGLQLTRALGRPSVRGYRRIHLTYSLPGDLVPRFQPTRAGGLLDRIATASHRLHDTYSWEEQQATVFIVSGIPPAHAAIRAEDHISSVAAARRLFLSVDPMVPPQELSAFYRSVRRRPGRRFVPLGSKHASLAEFAASLPAKTWPERMALWNDAHPEWRYSDPRRFGRDTREAQRRLLRG